MTLYLSFKQCLANHVRGACSTAAGTSRTDQGLAATSWPHLVAIQCRLDELTDLLKHCRLVSVGAKHLVKCKGVLLGRLAGQAAGHGNVNASAQQVA